MSSEEVKETPTAAAASSSPSNTVSYILVGEEGNEGDAIELPVEPSGTMPLSTLQAQFPGATCLKFKHSETGRFRGIKLADNFLYPPEAGWRADDVYIVTYPKDHKRKAEEEICTTASGKPKKLEKKCVDLLVQSIPYHLNNQSLRTYFEKFGDVVFCDIKRDTNGSSRGFGFIRFSDYEVQEKVIVLRHIIDGRWCDVKIPNSQLMDQVMRNGSDVSRSMRSSGGGYDRRIFIGRLNQEISNDVLRSYFSKHGEVLDVFVPHPFRRWAFVTFKDPEIARSLVGRSMIIEDQSVQISYATPPKSKQQHQASSSMSSTANSEIGDELSSGVVRPKRGYSSSPLTYGYNDNSWDGSTSPNDYFNYPESPGWAKHALEHNRQDHQSLSGPPARRVHNTGIGQPSQPQHGHRLQNPIGQCNPYLMTDQGHRQQPPPLISSNSSSQSSVFPPQSGGASSNPFLNPALLAQALTAVMSQWSQPSEGHGESGSSNVPPPPSSKPSSYQYDKYPPQHPPPGPGFFGPHSSNAGGRSPFGGGSSSGSTGGYQPF